MIVQVHGLSLLEHFFSLLLHNNVAYFRKRCHRRLCISKTSNTYRFNSCHGLIAPVTAEVIAFSVFFFFFTLQSVSVMYAFNLCRFYLYRLYCICKIAFILNSESLLSGIYRGQAIFFISDFQIKHLFYSSEWLSQNDLKM